MKAVFSKEQILKEINKYGEIIIEWEDLEHPFGFKRMDGEELMLRKLISSKNEEQLQTAPPYQIHESIEAWCKENFILYHFDHQLRQYHFKKYK